MRNTIPKKKCVRIRESEHTCKEVGVRILGGLTPTQQYVSGVMCNHQIIPALQTFPIVRLNQFKQPKQIKNSWLRVLLPH